MTPDLLIGLAAVAVPAYVVGYLMLAKNKAVFRMFVAMLLIGLGYLYVTGALQDIGATFARHTQTTAAPAVVTPAKTPAAETKTAPAAAEQPTKTEAAPAAEETKTVPAAADTPAAPETKPAPSTQVDPYPGAPKPAQ